MAYGRSVRRLCSLVFFLLCSSLGSLLILPDCFGQGGAALAAPFSQEGGDPGLEPPQKARDLLKAIQERQGAPLPGYIGGREFHNRERRLPRGRYREYDVNQKVPGRPRDGERIVIEQRTGKAYYTGDHYRTFVPLN